jgi:hypothetical protein
LKGTFTVANQASRNASSTFVNFFLSDNEVHDEADLLLKSLSTGSIKAGLSKSYRLSITLPPGKTAYGRYVIAVIDPNNSVAELNEENNVVVFGPFELSYDGTWKGEWQSDVYHRSGGLTVLIHQDGSHISGAMTFEDTPVGNIETSYEGTFSGNEFSYTCSFTFFGQPHIIQLEGNFLYQENQISGGYTITGSLINDSGSFYIKRE